MPYGLSQSAIDRIVEVLSSDPSVERVWLFGSRALGTEHTGSDIDLCLDGEGLDLDALLHLENRIDSLDLPWKVDLLAWSGIDNPDLRSHIERVGKLWFERDST